MPVTVICGPERPTGLSGYRGPSILLPLTSTHKTSKTMIKAAKVDDKEPILCSLFAKALEGKDVKELLLNVGFGGGSSATAPATGSPTATAGSGTALAEEKKEEKEEEKEESDDDIGFGRFD